MRSERIAGGYVWLLVVGVSLLLDSCAPRRVAIEKPGKKLFQRGVYHVVERHQTLYRISKTYDVDLRKVAAINGISDPSRIQVGQQILIPGAKRVLKVEIYIEDVLEEAEKKEKGRAAYPKIDFLWPVEGRLTELFDERENRRHQGIDISAPAGTPVRASSSGSVIYSGNTIRGYGNLVILRHSGEWVTVYAHNQVNLVEEGMEVERGQIIGRVGETGRASGPHLHFEIRKGNEAVDPLPLLK